MSRCKPSLSRLLVLLCMILLGTAPALAAATACSRPVHRPFRVFDGTGYTGKPDLPRPGIEPINIVDRGIWAPGRARTDAPDPGLVRAYVNALPNDRSPIVLDFEDFDWTRNDRSAVGVVARMTQMVRAFRSAARRHPVGWYG